MKLHRLHRLAVLFILASMLCTLANASNNEDISRKKKNAQRPKIGLVLGGGGAKGAAEVGVLKYIEEAGIKIDYIAGTSIGSIIGALYSVGYRANDLDSLFHSQEWLSLLADRKMDRASRFITKEDSAIYLFGFPIKRPKIRDPHHTKTIGLSRGDSLVSLFSNMTRCPDSIDFDKLPIPFRCVAVDLRKFQEVVIDKGSLPIAMRASMAIPGVFKPVETDGMMLVDGGLLNNLPVDVVKEMGADIVIAIDLTQHKHKNRKVKDKEENLHGFGALLKWIIERPDLYKYDTNSGQADIYINPDLKGFSAADFTPKKISKMIERGEEAGKAAMDELRALKK